MPDIDWDKYANFSREEFACRCGCGRADMDPEFLQRLQTLRDRYRKPIHINSGFRCPEYNARVSTTGTTGPHTTGKACDTGVILGKDAYNLVRLALGLGFTGIGLKQHGAVLGRFIHLDTIPEGERRPWIWTY